MASFRQQGKRWQARVRRQGYPVITKSFDPGQIRRVSRSAFKKGRSGTVVRELAYFSSIINHGRRERSIHANNPVALVRKPTQLKGRDRALSPAEREKLLIELQPTGRRNVWMPSVVILALGGHQP